MKRRALPDLSHVLEDLRPMPVVPVFEKRIHTRFDKAFIVVIGSELYGDSVAIARNVSFVIAGAGSFVIARTTSFLVSWLALVRCNSEGASVCACACALEMTRSDIVANARPDGRDMKARYAGNCDVGQAFFSYF